MFSEEQVRKLNDISKLDKERQQVELQEFLKELTPEQIEYLKNQQGCLICNIASKQIESSIIYEDEDCMAVLDINPANLGHTLVFPKKHAEFYWQIDDKINVVVKKLIPAIIDGVRADGVNVFNANGGVAGQRIKHAVVHIIPRFKDDGIRFEWNARKMSKNEIAKIAGEITSKIVKKEEKIEKEKEVIINEDVSLDERIP